MIQTFSTRTKPPSNSPSPQAGRGFGGEVLHPTNVQRLILSLWLSSQRSQLSRQTLGSPALLFQSLLRLFSSPALSFGHILLPAFEKAAMHRHLSPLESPSVQALIPEIASTPNLNPMHLDHYTTGTYTPGAPLCKQLLWYFLGDPLVRSQTLPFSTLKVWILRSFGAQIGQKVRIKPGVRVKFPWRLIVGDFVWIGENAWIDNLATVTLESHVCISQDVYLCTGNHDWSHPDFQLIPAEIHIQEGSWIAARAAIGPGVTVGRGAVLTLGGVAGRSLEPMTIYSGNPAQPVKKRVIKGFSGKSV